MLVKQECDGSGPAEENQTHPLPAQSFTEYIFAGEKKVLTGSSRTRRFPFKPQPLAWVIFLLLMPLCACSRHNNGQAQSDAAQSANNAAEGMRAARISAERAPNSSSQTDKSPQSEGRDR
jgi:hypothetical protein